MPRGGGEAEERRRRGGGGTKGCWRTSDIAQCAVTVTPLISLQLMVTRLSASASAARFLLIGPAPAPAPVAGLCGAAGCANAITDLRCASRADFCSSYKAREEGDYLGTI